MAEQKAAKEPALETLRLFEHIVSSSTDMMGPLGQGLQVLGRERRLC